MEIRDQTQLPPDLQILKERHPAYVAALQKNLRWNYTVRSFDNITISITMAALSETTVLPFFVSQLTSNAIVVGLIPAVAWLGLYAPQIFSAYIVHSRTERKPFILLMAWMERVAILGMLLAALLASTAYLGAAVFLLLLSFAGLRASAALLIPPYEDFYAKHIPQGRGVFFGVQMLLGGLAGLVGAWLVDRQIESLPFPQSFQMVIAFALVAALIGMPVLYKMNEVVYPVRAQAKTLRVYLGEIWPMIRARKTFLQFLGLRSLLGVGKMGTPFIAIYALSRFGLEARTIALYTAVMLAAQSGSAILWGYFGDRVGTYTIWLLDAVLIAAQAVIVWAAPSPDWFIVVFILLGISIGAEFIGQPVTVYALSPPDETARFVGISNTLLGITLALGPILGSILINLYSFETAFLAASLLAALGVPAALLWMKTSKRETI